MDGGSWRWVVAMFWAVVAIGLAVRAATGDNPWGDWVVAAAWLIGTILWLRSATEGRG